MEHSDNDLRHIKHKLNSRMTKHEKRFRALVIGMYQGIKVKSNEPILRRYFVDFFFPDHLVCVEVDGKSHRDPIQQSKDRDRDATLRKNGYRVFRFLNHESDHVWARRIKNIFY